jgi:hypothetical protein
LLAVLPISPVPFVGEEADGSFAVSARAIGYFTGSTRGRSTAAEVAFEEGDMAAAIP